MLSFFGLCVGRFPVQTVGEMSSHFCTHLGRDSSVTGALFPLLKGFLLLRMSKATSIRFKNSQFASLPWNSYICASSRRYSIATATELLNVCAANFTFILCFVHDIYVCFSLFAKLNPISCWSLCNSSRYLYSIFSSFPFCS